MKVAVLCIGTELTRGEVQNTNATWIGERMAALGVGTRIMEVVPDEAEAIVESVKRLGAEFDAIVCTGGLGPTTDDITSVCVGQALGVPLQRDATSVRAIEERIARFGRVMAESNRKQADFPIGASVLPNLQGTAPGFSVQLGKARGFFMPGVPREMKPMFETHVAPFIAARLECPAVQVRLRLYGAGESEINDRLEGLEARHQVTVGYRARFPEIEVKLLAQRESQEAALAAARAAADDAMSRLGELVYGEGDLGLPDVVGQLLRERGQTLALAESCTGGWVAKLFTERAGSSDYFVGGAVTYSNAAKNRVLKVSAADLERHGAVSATVARQLAEGARSVFGADLALSFTGIAGPGGGSDDKPVGLVHFAVSDARGTSARSRVFQGARDRVQLGAAYAGIHLLRQVLLEGHVASGAERGRSER